MGVASKPDIVSPGAAVDPHVLELGKLMLARAPKLGKAMAELLCREIDAYRDGSVVTRDQVAESCAANLTFIFHSLAGDADISPAEQTGTERALAGVPLPAVMTAYRIGFRFMWEETLATARAAAIPTESILDATARVFFAQETFTQAMSNAYRQQLTAQIVEREEERSALVEALLSRRMTDRQSLWEAADLLRLPTSGPYVVVAAELPAIGKLGLPAIENKLSARDIRSAWRLLPYYQVGIVHLRHSSDSLGTLVEVLRQSATARVGISPPFQELSETSDALRYARLAVTGKASTGSLVTVFDDTPLAVAAVSAPEVMAKIRTSLLGRLDELPDEERAVLLDTFQAWLQSGGSANDTCGDDLLPSQHRAPPAAPHRGLGRPIALPAKGSCGVVPGVRDRAESCLSGFVSGRQEPIASWSVRDITRAEVPRVNSVVEPVIRSSSDRNTKCHKRSPDNTAQRRNEGEAMFAAITQITIYLSLVLAPVLIPAAFHIFNVVRQRPQPYTQVRAVRVPQATAYRRLAVPAAA
jgi:GGDEF-like domain